MFDTPELPPILSTPPRIYGVWLSPGNANGEGWLRGPEHNLFGVEDIELARQTAQWFHGRVLITDDEYKDFEAQMLSAERRQRHGLFAKRH